jgi:hypothetical protein
MPQSLPVPAYPIGLAQRRLGPLALLVGLVLSLSIATKVPAATTWTVCASGCDYASIKAAIAAPTTVDGDTLAIAAGVYTEPGIVVDKSLTLQGEEAASTVVQAAASPGTASDRVFMIPSGVTVTLEGLMIRYGHKNGLGGGLSNAGTLTLTRSTIRGNMTTGYSNGGGLYNDGALTLTNSTVGDNAASWGGGGLFNAGTLTLTNSTVGDNAASWGGGLYSSFYSKSAMTLIASTIRNNAAGVGGGLSNGGTLTFINTTLSGNTATGAGGGLYNDGTLTLTHSTLSGNAADAYGGGLSNAGTLTLTHSIVAQNPDGGDCRNHFGAISSQGYNLDSDGSCHLTAATDRPGTDPLLGPLQDNGGPTFTHALLPGSPALDAIPWGTNGCGTTLFSDQRWQARPQTAGGACDIGAYEVAVAGQPLGAWVAGVTPHTVVCENVTTGGAVTLNDPAIPWDCEAAGLVVTTGDQVALRVRGPVTKGALDVGGAVVGLAPNGGGCTNRTTGQQVKFQALFQGEPGATAASCLAAGLIVQPGDTVQMRVQGVAE